MEYESVITTVTITAVHTVTYTVPHTDRTTHIADTSFELPTSPSVALAADSLPNPAALSEDAGDSFFCIGRERTKDYVIVFN